SGRGSALPLRGVAQRNGTTRKSAIAVPRHRGGGEIVAVLCPPPPARMAEDRAAEPELIRLPPSRIHILRSPPSSVLRQRRACAALRRASWRRPSPSRGRW